MSLTCEGITRAALGEPAKRVGQELLWHCPRHDDQHPSLSINPEKDCWLCGPCGKGGNVWALAAFLAGISASDKTAVMAWLREHGLVPPASGKRGSEEQARQSITVADLARDKRLPIEFLASLGVENCPQGVRITYRLEDGTLALRQRIRTALVARKGSFWSNGSGSIVPYGLWRLEEARKAGFTVLVEGESDAWTLWFHNYPSVGLPGADTAGKLEATHLTGIGRIYAVQEPDSGGATFIALVAARLREIGWQGEAYRVALVDAKDPNDLHKRDPDGFQDAFERALDKAERLPEAAGWSDTQARDVYEGRVPGGSNRESQATRLLSLTDELIERGELELFHNELGDPFARVRVGAHFENLSVRGRAFHEWLQRLSFHATGRICNQQAIAGVKDLLAAQANYDGPEHRLWNRVAWHDGAIWYDLSDTEWRAVRVTRAGWTLETSPPILFRRFSHQRAQLEPKRGGDIDNVLAFLNLRDLNARRLLATAILSFFVPEIPHPVLALYGEHGSGKTTECRFARAWVDPSETPTLGEPDRNEIIQALAHNYVLPLDNLRSVDPWLSDILCRAVTGEGFSKRKLYTDEDDIILSYRRCVLINGVNSLPRRPDLMARSILFELEPIPEEKRREEVEVVASFQGALPYLLGATFTVLAKAMKLRDELSLAALPRMADFARWGAAISQAAGWGTKEFVNTYACEARARNEAAIEASPVAEAIRTFAERQPREWEGTAGALLRELAGVAAELGIDTRAREWPRQPNVLSRRLNDVIPKFRQAGIKITHVWKERSRKIIVTTVASVVSPSNQRAFAPTKNNDHNDDNDIFLAPHTCTNDMVREPL